MFLCCRHRSEFPMIGLFCCLIQKQIQKRTNLSCFQLRDNDITSVLIGASKPSQIIDNVGMLKNPDFSKEEREEIDRILA